MVGCLALLADGLGANAEDVLFSGQRSIPNLVSRTRPSSCWCCSLRRGSRSRSASAAGSGRLGVPGGLLGIALATLALIAFDVSPTLAVAAGTAAGMAAMTRLVFAAVLFAGLLVGTVGHDAIHSRAGRGRCWLTVAAIDERFPMRRLP